MQVRFPAGPDDLISWVASEPGFMQRASHAVVAGDATWLIDPVDHPDVRARLSGLPPVAGVVQLLDRHGRDCAGMAASLGVSLYVTPRAPVGDAPFEVLEVRWSRHWRESALWWPERACLVVAESLGASPYFRAPGQRVGVHPMVRLTPPRVLAGLPARHLLVGHGDPIHDPGAGAMATDAVAHARSSTPRWALALVTGSVRRADRGRPILDRR